MQHHSDEVLQKLVEALLESFEGLLRKEQVGKEVSQSEENAYQSWNQQPSVAVFGPIVHTINYDLLWRFTIII
jgi:hypothetical protein